MARVLGVLGGKDLPLETLAAWARTADVVVAADSGADACLALGVRPIVVGDMDSFKGDRSELQVVEDPDQDTTDCDKLLAYVESLGHKSIVIACLEGDRLDHVLASLASVARSNLAVSLIARNGLGLIVRQGTQVQLELIPGTQFSVLGLGHCVASLNGARWPFEDLDLTPPNLQGVSNRSLGDISLSVSDGVALLTVEGHGEPWNFPWQSPSAPI